MRGSDVASINKTNINATTLSGQGFLDDTSGTKGDYYQVVYKPDVWQHPNPDNITKSSFNGTTWTLGYTYYGPGTYQLYVCSNTNPGCLSGTWSPTVYSQTKTTNPPTGGATASFTGLPNGTVPVDSLYKVVYTPPAAPGETDLTKSTLVAGTWSLTYKYYGAGSYALQRCTSGSSYSACTVWTPVSTSIVPAQTKNDLTVGGGTGVFSNLADANVPYTGIYKVAYTSASATTWGVHFAYYSAGNYTLQRKATSSSDWVSVDSKQIANMQPQWQDAVWDSGAVKWKINFTYSSKGTYILQKSSDNQIWTNVASGSKDITSASGSDFLYDPSAYANKANYYRVVCIPTGGSILYDNNSVQGYAYQVIYTPATWETPVLDGTRWKVNFTYYGAGTYTLQKRATLTEAWTDVASVKETAFGGQDSLYDATRANYYQIIYKPAGWNDPVSDSIKWRVDFRFYEPGVYTLQKRNSPTEAWVDVVSKTEDGSSGNDSLYDPSVTPAAYYQVVHNTVQWQDAVSDSGKWRIDYTYDGSGTYKLQRSEALGKIFDATGSWVGSDYVISIPQHESVLSYYIEYRDCSGDGSECTANWTRLNSGAAVAAELAGNTSWTHTSYAVPASGFIRTYHAVVATASWIDVVSKPEMASAGRDSLYDPNAVKAGRYQVVYAPANWQNPVWRNDWLQSWKIDFQYYKTGIYTLQSRNSLTDDWTDVSDAMLYNASDSTCDTTSTTSGSCSFYDPSVNKANYYQIVYVPVNYTSGQLDLTCGASCTLSFNYYGAGNYKLQRRTSLTGDWTDVISKNETETSGSDSFTDPGSAAYHRIVYTPAEWESAAPDTSKWRIDFQYFGAGTYILQSKNRTTDTWTDVAVKIERSVSGNDSFYDPSPTRAAFYQILYIPSNADVSKMPQVQSIATDSSRWRVDFQYFGTGTYQLQSCTKAVLANCVESDWGDVTGTGTSKTVVLGEGMANAKDSLYDPRTTPAAHYRVVLVPPAAPTCSDANCTPTPEGGKQKITFNYYGVGTYKLQQSQAPDIGTTYSVGSTTTGNYQVNIPLHGGVLSYYIEVSEDGGSNWLRLNSGNAINANPSTPTQWTDTRSAPAAGITRTYRAIVASISWQDVTNNSVLASVVETSASGGTDYLYHATTTAAAKYRVVFVQPTTPTWPTGASAWSAASDKKITFKYFGTGNYRLQKRSGTTGTWKDVKNTDNSDASIDLELEAGVTSGIAWLYDPFSSANDEYRVVYSPSQILFNQTTGKIATKVWKIDFQYHGAGTYTLQTCNGTCSQSSDTGWVDTSFSKIETDNGGVDSLYDESLNKAAQYRVRYDPASSTGIWEQTILLDHNGDNYISAQAIKTYNFTWNVDSGTTVTYYVRSKLVSVDIKLNLPIDDTTISELPGTTSAMDPLLQIVENSFINLSGTADRDAVICVNTGTGSEVCGDRNSGNGQLVPDAITGSWTYSFSYDLTGTYNVTVYAKKNVTQEFESTTYTYQDVRSNEIRFRVAFYAPITAPTVNAFDRYWDQKITGTSSMTISGSIPTQSRPGTQICVEVKFSNGSPVETCFIPQDGEQDPVSGQRYVWHYDLDFSQLGAGDYTIRVRTYNQDAYNPYDPTSHYSNYTYPAIVTYIQ